MGSRPIQKTLCHLMAKLGFCLHAVENAETKGDDEAKAISDNLLRQALDDEEI